MMKAAISRHLLLAAGALGLLGLGWLIGRQPVPQQAADTGGLQRQAGVQRGALEVDDIEVSGLAVGTLPAPETAPAPHGAGTAPAPLPPPDTPLREVIDELRERARRGDVSAACRLAAELQRCQFAQLSGGRFGNPLERRAAREDDPQRREAMIDSLVRLEEAQERNAMVCAGIGEDALGEAFALQQMAALARPELRVWAASNPALDPGNFLANLPQWQQYRSTAMGWLEAAAAEGDPGALMTLARIHGTASGRERFGHLLRDPDDARFLLYAQLLEQRGITVPPLQRNMEEARSRLSPAEAAAIDAEAARLSAAMPAKATDPASFSRTAGRAFASLPDPADCE